MDSNAPSSPARPMLGNGPQPGLASGSQAGLKGLLPSRRCLSGYRCSLLHNWRLISMSRRNRRRTTQIVMRIPTRRDPTTGINVVVTLCDVVMSRQSPLVSGPYRRSPAVLNPSRTSAPAAAAAKTELTIPRAVPKLATARPTLETSTRTSPKIAALLNRRCPRGVSILTPPRLDQSRKPQRR